MLIQSSIDRYPGIYVQERESTFSIKIPLLKGQRKEYIKRFRQTLQEK